MLILTFVQFVLLYRNLQMYICKSTLKTKSSAKFLARFTSPFFHVSILHKWLTRCVTAQVSITAVAKLTIWGPTFTLIGPKVFGKIFVGEFVLETGNAIIEILPKKKKAIEF